MAKTRTQRKRMANSEPVAGMGDLSSLPQTIDYTLLMPTILRFRGFNIVIYTFDHRPAHVHAKGSGVEASFFLNCVSGAVILRESAGTSLREETDLARFIAGNRDILCAAWEAIHGHAR